VTDREKYGLRGDVHSLRQEFAELDFTTEGWLPARHSSVTVFLRDGRLDHIENHNPDGSVVRSVYRYDSAGRLTEMRSGDSSWTHHYDDLGRIVRVIGPSGDLERFRYETNGSRLRIQLVPSETQARNAMFSCGVEGSEHSYSAQGTVEIHTLYDTAGHTVEIRFLNAGGGLLNRVVCMYDPEGRLLREGQIPGEALPIRDLLLMQMAGLGGEISSTEYEYDSQGRRIVANRCLGKVMNERVARRYDQFGNKIEETHDETKCDLSVGPTGMKPDKESHSCQSVRFEYQYDEQGNWTEQVVSTRPEPNPNFQPQNVHRRVITYWE
jgi:YD repeat-containing protein